MSKTINITIPVAEGKHLELTDEQLEAVLKQLYPLGDMMLYDSWLLEVIRYLSPATLYNEGGAWCLYNRDRSSHVIHQRSWVSYSQGKLTVSTPGSSLTLSGDRS